MNDRTNGRRSSSRREFLKQSGGTLAGAALLGAVQSRAYGGENNTIKLALVGCGGRGTGAAAQAMSDRAAGTAGTSAVVTRPPGVTIASMQARLGPEAAIVRCMPNTPAMVRSGATALYANTRVSEAQRSLAESVLRAVGLALWLDDEAQMDAVTALSGSGPAYFFLFMEALQAAGTELGLPPDTARLLSLQTAFGAAKMVLESREDAATLRRQVTSPGGTTERAIEVFTQEGLQGMVLKALQAAAGRSRELADEFGGNPV